MAADVLLLNRHFHAIHVTSWQRALTLVYADRALVVDEEYRTYNFENWLEATRTVSESPGGFVTTPNIRIAIPEVIALKFFGKVPKHEVPFTRRNIYQHYGNRCCYCGHLFPSTDLNLEHIVPRSRGGKTDWANIVTSCIPCNLRKGNRLPDEAGMKLIVHPSRPKWQNGMSLLIRSPLPIRRSWQRFIDKAYWDSKLEE